MIEFIDKELGSIIVFPHKKAKRVTARRKNAIFRSLCLTGSA